MTANVNSNCNVEVLFTQNNESIHLWETSGDYWKNIDMLMEAALATGLIDCEIALDYAVFFADDLAMERTPLVKGSISPEMLRA